MSANRSSPSSRCAALVIFGLVLRCFGGLALHHLSSSIHHTNHKTTQHPTTTTTTMKLNQATAAALLLSASTLASSSLAASASSHDELKDDIAPLLASKPINYLHRMLQLSDECIADAIYGYTPAFNDALNACASTTVVGNTETTDYSACPLSRLTEACAADNGAIVAGFGEINWDCTYKQDESVLNIILDKQDESVLNIIQGESHWCVHPSCVSEWESGQGQMSDEFLNAWEKEWESDMSQSLADFFGYEAGDVECKINRSNAGKATGMLALAATAAATAALFLF